MNSTNSAQSNLDIADLTYEAAFSELERVVASLESGEQALDQALSLYERGKHLAAYCSKLLDQAELKVSLLSGDQLVEFHEPE